MNKHFFDVYINKFNKKVYINKTIIRQMCEQIYK